MKDGSLSLGLVTFAATLTGLGLLCWCKKGGGADANERGESVPLQTLSAQTLVAEVFEDEESAFLAESGEGDHLKQS